ncbi:MAG TPA: MaoC/PaaZ C-terminal domain-containing protein [Candidatus Binatia bacterium]|nr:MaoC/PaaZ C-terminal domain-containing protein [Candidatus Binatia bacterium]
MPLTWESIKEGDELLALKKKPTVTQLVKYAAGSGDFNPLHHDYNFPQSKLIGSIIVHGRFKYAALGELVSNWLGHQGRIRKISCQYRGMDFPDRELTCGGKVIRKWEDGGRKLVDLQLWAENDEGKKTTPGTATVELR